MTIALGTLKEDAQVTGWVGLAHFFSHFFQLVLPPLFPLLQPAFGVSYTELGMMMTLFFAVSGLAQTAAGFVVDHYGAHRVLILGLGLLSASVLLMGFAPGFLTMLPLVVLAGIGNSVFHPADYAILTGKIAPGRLARAYSVHTFGGTLGWAAAPATMIALASLADWRQALIAVGAVGLAVVLMLTLQRQRITLDQAPPRPAAATGRRAAARVHAGVLLAAPVLLCFVYFALLSLSLTGLQTFLPVTLLKLHATPLALGGTALTAFLVGSSLGILIGGWLADRTPNHDRIVAFGLLAAALLLLVLGAWSLSALGLVALVGLAGVLSGMTMPSRDMLVRAATPPGGAGKVFGFVYSGLDLGAAVAPAVIGVLLDNGRPMAAIVFTAAGLAVTASSAIIVKRRAAAARAAA